MYCFVNAISMTLFPMCTLDLLLALVTEWKETNVSYN